MDRERGSPRTFSPPRVARTKPQRTKLHCAEPGRSRSGINLRKISQDEAALSFPERKGCRTSLRQQSAGKRNQDVPGLSGTKARFPGISQIEPGRSCVLLRFAKLNQDGVAAN